MRNSQSSFILRNRHFLFIDILIFVFAAIASYEIRLETVNLRQYAGGILLFLVIATPVKLVAYLPGGMYRQYWKNAGPGELLVVAFACAASGSAIIFIFFLLSLLLPESQGLVPRSIPIIDMLLTSSLVLVSRFSLRGYRHVNVRRTHRQRNGDVQRRHALIIGAGNTGIRVLEALDNGSSALTVVGFLDDDSGKAGTYVRGVRVLGKIDDLRSAVADYGIDLVVIAVPSAPGKLIRQIAHTCQQIGVDHRIMPGMIELLAGKASINTLRPISIEDLLRRAPIQLDVTDIQQQLRGRCIMVTGAGGSIGSELSRQIARCEPARLLLVGHGENSLFLVGNQLKAEFPRLQTETLLADVRDLPHLEAIFAQKRPEIVFHAAAHKHVPMLESNVIEATTNNIIGTRNMIDLCNRFNVQRMVVISTDKAVKPSNVMGLTKRVAEMLVMAAAQQHPMRFAVVRFGNVLGSRGSVVPIFEQQIAMGGPLTITSDEMTRYFMSIPEAVLLVLKAGVLTQQGPLFVLNMGDPVRILDLAHDLIRLNGAEPGHDVEIQVTGPRPGEKLYEELFWENESHQPVEDGTIFAVNMLPAQLHGMRAQMDEFMRTLAPQLEKHDEEAVRSALQKAVFAPTGNGYKAESSGIIRPVTVPRQTAQTAPGD